MVAPDDLLDAPYNAAVENKAESSDKYLPMESRGWRTRLSLQSGLLPLLTIAMNAIHYRITPASLHAHLFEVVLTVEQPDPAGQVFSLPTWIPGSYMIREFARNIVRIRAESDGQAVALEKCDKQTWRAAPCRAPLLLTYEVYAWDLSVRCAHLDQLHGFFNGTQVFLQVHGAESLPHLVDIQPPQQVLPLPWRVATTLPEAVGLPGAAARYGFGLYRAGDYDELLDHPVEMGTFKLIGFEAGGVPHEMAITGSLAGADVDWERLAGDLARICNWQIQLFGTAPFERFLFLTFAVGEGYGGLEHRASTALICSRYDLPAKAASSMSDAYIGFLGLCSHEYFHAWNVKRIKPAAFTPYDLSRENYTRLLWAFEGFTSYYDDLALLKSGVIDQAQYLKLLAKTCNQVWRGSGRLKQSVAESSFDAWVKYYRQDENAPNAIVSYYTKGALVALALDLKLRAASDGRISLDQVMQALWQGHGQTGIGVPEDGILQTAEAVSGLKLARFLNEATEGTSDLPLAALLQPLGVRFELETSGSGVDLGVKTTADGNDCKLTQVLEGSAAQQAGMAAGDILIALDGIRVTAANLEKLLARYRPGASAVAHVFRRDELLVMGLDMAAPTTVQAKINPAPRASAKAKRLRQGWLT